MTPRARLRLTQRTTFESEVGYITKRIKRLTDKCQMKPDRLENFKNTLVLPK